MSFEQKGNCFSEDELFRSPNLKRNIIASSYTKSWCGNIILNSCPKHGILEFHNYKATSCLVKVCFTKLREPEL